MDGKFRLLLLCLFAAKQSFSTPGQVNRDNTAIDSDSSWFFFQDQTNPRDCKDVQDQCPTQNSTRAHLIRPSGYHEPFWVFCSGEWTVIQRRSDWYIEFNRSWTEYRDGFGFINIDYWLGNERLAYLTNQKAYELRVEFETESGSTAYISYGGFRINDEFSDYSLVSLGQYSGTAGSVIMWCPPNMIPGVCSRCIATCADPSGTVDCSNDCTSTPHSCVCPSNYLMNGTNCVARDECGCYKQGHGVIPENGNHTTADCSERCTCNSGVLACVTLSCAQDATCKAVGGVRDCYCPEGYEGDGQICNRQFNGDCYDIKTSGTSTSGNYTTTPSGWTRGPFTVNCNMTIDGGGWTVIQRRIQSSSRQSFNQNWRMYRDGFGTPSGEFWIGNEKLHNLTNQKDYELRIDMVNLNHVSYYAKYDLFRITGESDKYRLSDLGTFTGTTGYDRLRYHHDMYFSTPDRDNDRASSAHCADFDDGGWWYNDCAFYCVLNYDYLSNSVGRWYGLPGNSYLVYTEMKIRPREANL